MKVTDLRKKLLAALAAAGMLGPAAAYAANLNQNLVVNGDFEHVDTNTTSPFNYNGPLILDWTATRISTSAFAYSHNQGVTGVPDYANGSDPTNPGLWYFTSNRKPYHPGFVFIDTPSEFYQDVNVAAGDSAVAISSGFAKFNLSAWMSTFGTNRDKSNVQLDFRSTAGATLGSYVLSDSDAGTSNIWNLNQATPAAIPKGTSTIRVSLFGTKIDGAGPDGYIDNVDVRVTQDPLPVLAAVVDRSTGNITLKNLTTGSVNISGYSFTSAFESIAPATWLSIADNYDSGNPGPNQVDASHAWSKLTVATSHTDLSEADLQSGVGGAIGLNKSVNLGDNTWVKTSHEELAFQYISNGLIVNGIVAYVGNNGAPFANGDLNTDGVINASDWVILRNNQFANLSSLTSAQAYRAGDLTGDKIDDHADFALFKSAYEGANGSGSFATMLASIPEPCTVALVCAAGFFVYPTIRRRSNI